MDQGLNASNEVPPIGFGTSKDNLDEVCGKVKFALQVGYRMIDTAAFYGNEKQIGEAIRQTIESGALKREDIFVITKLPPIGAQRVRHFMEKSLRNLQLDYVDLYLLHNMFFLKYGKDDYEMVPYKDGELQLDYTHYQDVWKDMEKCVDDGLCRAIGLSNCNAFQLEDISKTARIKPMNIQVECHVHLQEEALLQKCRELGVTMTAFAPLGSPNYGAHMNRKHGIEIAKTKTVLEEPILCELATKYKRTPAQVALRWLHQRGITPIPKSFNENRIKENFQIFDFTLTDEEMNRIKEANRNERHFTYKELCKGIENHPSYPFKERNF